jgi:2-hydroxychromene-2-carboxylate isomerase
MSVKVLHYSDPGCPWAYSASPAHGVLRWRYGDQLEWRLITIGLTETAEQYIVRGYTPAGSARGYLRFRRFGMPFATQPRHRVAATGLACRAIHATRLQAPECEHAVFRALQFAWFTTPLVLDDPDDVAAAIDGVEGIRPGEIIAALHDPAVEEAYQADRAEARTAAGSPTEFQGKAAATDGPVRYTAPSLVFEHDGLRLEAGGFQPLEAYDMAIANLDTSLERLGPPDTPLEALAESPEGLVTAEVAAIMAGHLQEPDLAGAEAALIDLVGEGCVTRVSLGNDALWRLGPNSTRRLRSGQDVHVSAPV